MVFPDELEGKKTYLTSSAIVYAIFAESLLGGNEPKNLGEAKLTSTDKVMAQIKMDLNSMFELMLSTRKQDNARFR